MDDYLARRRELSRQAISTMIRARMEFQTMVYAMMDTASLDDALRQSLYADLLKNSGEQANLEASTASALESLLDEAQRKAMRDAMKRPDPVRRR
jgi:predicted ATP-dependent protease